MPTPSLTEQLADRAVAERRADFAREMDRIVERTFGLIERAGTVDPPMRDILAETGLSTQAFYRHFRSKDELMLALLDDGRRRLVATLERRMRRAEGPVGRVQAWIEGVLAQAASAAAAARTRPWALSEERLAERFPHEHQTSVRLLVELLEPSIAEIRAAEVEGPASARTDAVMRLAPDSAARVDAHLVYRVVFATLRDHLVAGTSPSRFEIDQLVAFCQRGIANLSVRQGEGS